MLKSAKSRYRVDLSRQMAECEANYARLNKLMPHWPEQDQWIHAIQAGNTAWRLSITVQERARYTTTLTITQLDQLHDWQQPPQVQVRLYHDAKLAEVLQWHQHRRMQVRYDYPNDKMYQVDEKAQLNHFLGEWLTHCLAYGHADLGLEELGLSKK